MNSLNLYITLALLLLAGFFCLIRYIRFQLKFKPKQLRALGLYHEVKEYFQDPKSGAMKERLVSAKLKVKIEGKNIVFTKYASTLSVEDFETKKNKLEHILDVKISSISKRKPLFRWRQSEIVLHIEDFSRELSLDECPSNLQPGQYWVGKTAENTDNVLDIRKGDFSIFCSGFAGSGKGNAVYSMVDTFLGTWAKHKGHHTYNLVIIDAKGTDYIGLIKKYPGSISLNPLFKEDLLKAIKILEDYKSETDNYRRYLAQTDMSIPSWLDIPLKYPELKSPPKNLCLVLDELSQWNMPRHVKVNKDSPQEVLEMKEMADLQEKISALINSILQLNRSTGLFLVAANQSYLQDSMLLDRNNIVNSLLGRATAALSRQLLGDERILSDTSLKAGVFVFSGNGKIIKTQVPFALKPQK